MKKILFVLVLTFCLLPTVSFADQYVNGYYRSNGTYVKGYYRSSPDSSPYNNYSYPGNTNPYTGKTANGNTSTYLNNNYANSPSNVSTYTPIYSPTTRTSGTYIPTSINRISSEDIKPAYSGTVSYIKSPCDYFIAENSSGYALLEWYSGRTPYTGENIYGNFNSYGFKDIYTGVLKSKTHVWVDDYMLSRDRVIEKYLDKCE